MRSVIYPANAYIPCADLWMVTVYFNPAGYKALRRNYELFAAPIVRAGMHLITVECAFGEAPFELKHSPSVVHVRGRDVMWLQERLINLAIDQLPQEAQKVVWLDADLLFCNPGWALETSRLLDRFPLAQPCASLHRLEKHADAYEGRGYHRRSFACQIQRRPESSHLWASAHGFTGGAWAARRSLIEKHGLYDAAILGGNDELFAHASGNGLNSRCVKSITGARQRRLPRIAQKATNRLLRIPWPPRLAAWYAAHRAASPMPEPDEHFYAHYLRWAQPFAADVQGQIGYVPGMALHLWHGNPANRRYGERNAILQRHHFEPASDIRLNGDRVWEWASDKPQLHRDVLDYFLARLEDE